MGICLIVKSGGGIDTSSATVTADKILSGYTIYSNDNKVTGNMVNVGTQAKSGLNAGGSVTINHGYHNGSGSVVTNTLASQTSADIPDTSWCLSGYTYWKDGSKGTGTMANRGKKTWSLGVNGSQTIESGWHDGNGTVSQSGVKSDGTWRMLTPKTSQQTLCNGSTYYSQNQWCAGSSSLAAANIKKDITIFGVKGTYYDTNRYIIWNGQINPTLGAYLWYKTGSSSSNPSTSVSYNGATWYMIQGERDFLDANDNRKTTYECMLAVPSVTNWISFTWSFSKYGRLSSVHIGGIVKGELLVPKTRSGAGTIRMSVGIRPDGRSGTLGYWASNTDTFDVEWGADNTGAMPSTSLSAVDMSWGSGLPVNTMIVHTTTNFPANVDFGVFARNLWIDTTASFDGK